MPDEKDDQLASALRQAKKMPMNFAFVMVGSSDGVLMVSKKKIPMKDINEAKAESGGKKVMRGRVQFIDGQMVFETSKEPPSTLAKQLKKVIQANAGMMLQIETRLAPDLDEDSDEEGVESESTEDTVPEAPPIAPEATAKFAARLKALAPALQKAEATGNQLALEARRKAGEANQQFLAKNVDQALATLDDVEALIKQALLSAMKPPTAPPTPTNAPTTEAKPVSNVVYTQSRLLWDSTRKSIQTELQAAEKKILAHCQAVNSDPTATEEFDLSEAAAQVKSLYKILLKLDAKLMDKLDEALNAAEPNVRSAKQKEAKTLIEDYRAFVTADPVLDALGQSTIAPSGLKQTLLNVLNGLHNKL